MGCPVPKVCKTGAGAALLNDPDTAVAVAARRARGQRLPVTVKLRSRPRAGRDRAASSSRTASSTRPASRRSASTRARGQVHHKGAPDYDLAARLVDDAARAGDPLRRPARRRRTCARRYEQTGAAAVMLARGSLGNPWLFERLLGRREPASRRRDEVLDELDWVIDRAAEHLGPERAARYLRKFYPWYLERLRARRARCQDALPATAAARRGARAARAAVRAPPLPSPEGRARGPLILLALAVGRRAARGPARQRVFRASATVHRTRSHAEGRHPHPRRPQKLKDELEDLSDRQAPRGRRAHQGGARVRRHRRELRVRRRQERAGDARGADRAARGASCARRR